MPHAAEAPALESAFVVLVPAAEARVAALRQRFDPVAHLGVPAHITLLYPFMPAAQIDGGVLQRAAAAIAGIAPFDFMLNSIGRFPGTAYLAPDPAAPFIALTRALARAFPDWPPYRGAHAQALPHLSFAQGDEADVQMAAQHLAQAMQAQAAVEARCEQVALLAEDGGRWCRLHTLPLLATRT